MSLTTLEHPDRRIPVALVGTGQGAREIAASILQNPALHLRAVWSRTQEHVEQFNLEAAGRSLEAFHGEDGFAKLLSRDIEGYVVMLPGSVQTLYLARILQQKKHLLSQKPVAPDREGTAQALKNLEEAKHDGVLWFVSEPLRYEAVFQPGHLRLQDLGAVLSAEVHGVLVVPRVLDGPPPSNESLWIQGGVHFVAMLRMLLGAMTEVNCRRASDRAVRLEGGNGDEMGDVGTQTHKARNFWKDSLSGVIRFDNGVACTVNWQTSDRLKDERFRVTLWCERGTASVELDMGVQAASTATRRYTLRRQLHDVQAGTSGAAGQAAALLLPQSFNSIGLERNLDAWGRAIIECGDAATNSSRRGGRSPGKGQNQEYGGDDSPLHAIVDLMVVSAMVQSAGQGVHIREKSSRSSSK